MVLLQTFDKQCDFSPYTRKYNLWYHMVEGIKLLPTTLFLDSRPYEHFAVHIKQAFRRTLQRRKVRMIETVNVIKNLREGAAMRRR